LAMQQFEAAVAELNLEHPASAVQQTDSIPVMTCKHIRSWYDEPKKTELSSIDMASLAALGSMYHSSQMQFSMDVPDLEQTTWSHWVIISSKPGDARLGMVLSCSTSTPSFFGFDPTGRAGWLLLQPEDIGKALHAHIKLHVSRMHQMVPNVSLLLPDGLRQVDLLLKVPHAAEDPLRVYLRNSTKQQPPPPASLDITTASANRETTPSLLPLFLQQTHGAECSSYSS